MCLRSGGLTWQLVGLACMFGGFGWFVVMRARSVRGHVLELAGDSIRIRPTEPHARGLRRVITPEGVEDGYVVTPSRLVLRLRSGAAIEANLDADSAGEVMEHLGLATGQRALRTPFETRRFPDTIRGAWLETGVDGVRIVRGTRSRFIPYRAIHKVARAGRRIVLETTTGIVRTPRVDDTAEAVSALVSRIAEAGRAVAAQDAPALDALDRRERPMRQWRDALDELALEGKGFRGTALAGEDLEQILRNPQAPLERRIGAALALRSRSDNARNRIRVAAAASVEPRVRVALEAAAAEDVDDDALERALDKAEPAGDSRNRRT